MKRKALLDTGMEMISYIALTLTSKPHQLFMATWEMPRVSTILIAMVDILIMSVTLWMIHLSKEIKQIMVLVTEAITFLMILMFATESGLNGLMITTHPLLKALDTSQISIRIPILIMVLVMIPFMKHIQTILILSKAEIVANSSRELKSSLMTTR